MGWYRRTSTFITYAFRIYKSRYTLVVPRNPIQVPFNTKTNFENLSVDSQKPNPNSRIHLNNKPTSKITQFSQSILRNLNLQNGLKQNPLPVGAKRFHHMATRNQIQRFKPLVRHKRLFDPDNPRHVLSAFLIASGVLITLCFGNFETVPYSKRTHFVLLSRTLEKELGKLLFEDTKEKYKGKILAPDHPKSVRIRRISQDVIEALKKGLMKEQEARKKKKSETVHLEGLEWEVIVVDEPVMNAFCLPGGKIVVFTGLLTVFKDDVEVASIIGHEVGHAVARHGAEKILKTLWSIILQLILWQYIEPNFGNKISDLFLTLPFSRRMEMEADYIGLLLAASAGYDPRVAPKVYEKLGRLRGRSANDDYLSTHPSGYKRAQKLSQAKVMEEALSIYRQSTEGVSLSR